MCGRGRAGATTALKGISGDGGSVEVDAVDSGLASARGSACSKERRVAKLLDTVAWRKGEEVALGTVAANGSGELHSGREGEGGTKAWGERPSFPHYI